MIYCNIILQCFQMQVHRKVFTISSTFNSSFFLSVHTQTLHASQSQFFLPAFLACYTLYNVNCLIWFREDRYEISNFGNKLSSILSKLKAHLTRSKKEIGHVLN